MRAQELYNQYCRKQLTVNEFLYHVRRDPILKEYISPVNSAEDVILILKQRCSITEQVNEDQLIQEKEVEDDSIPDSTELEEYVNGDQEKYNAIDEKYGTDEIRDILERNDNLGFDLAGEAMNAILTHKDWNERWEVENVDDLNKITAWKKDVVQKAKSNRIQEAKKPNLTPDNVNYNEFHRGWRYELECNPKLQKEQDIDKAKEIALRNLEKDPIYYTNLKAKETEAKFKKKPNKESNKTPKAPADKVDLKDKVNQMKNVNKGKSDKGNVKTNLGKQEKAKGNPKGVKVMKLKESIRKELKDLLSENSYNQHVQALRDMVKMKPEDLAKQVISGQLPMSGLRKEFAAKVLAKHIEDGNKSKEVADAFRKLSDKLNEGMAVDSDGKLDDKSAPKVGDLYKWDKTNIVTKVIKISHGDKIDLEVVSNGDNPNSEFKIGQKFPVFGILARMKKIDNPDDVDLHGAPSKFSTNERVTIGDFQTWKKSVIEHLKTSLKTDDKAAEKIFKHYQSQFKANHESGKDAKTAVKDFTKGLKPKKEEFEGNTPPEKADFQDIKINEDSSDLVKDTIRKLNNIIRLGNEYINATRK